MKTEINQALLERIYQRAKGSLFGIGEPERPLNFNNWSAGTPTTQTLASVLVGAFHDKYDLISIMQAAIEEVSE